MSQHGIILGCLVGFFGTITLTLMWFDLSLILPVVATLLIISMCGALVGIIYGAISGYISGLLMAFLTRYIFRQVKWIAVYRITVGMITFGVTLTIILVGQMGLSIDQEQVFARSISMSDWQSLWIMGLVFAVYASQQVVTEYLREIIDYK
jgi:hypothetical protein